MAKVEVFTLAELSCFFATRPSGKEVARCFCDIFAQTKPDTMVVGWGGVRAASPSFIDEFVNTIQEDPHAGPHRGSIVFIGENASIIDLVDTVLKRRAFPIRYAVRQDNLDESPVRLLGN